MAEPAGHDATRRSYDSVAENYAAQFRTELDGKPLDRALLGCLVEQAVPGAPVADLGCGPGHVTGWLADRGVAAVGIDLSPAMVAAARRDYLDAQFRAGDLLQLPAADGEFGVAVMFYAIIHLAPGELTRAFAETRRVLRPGGHALVSFHLGDEVRHLDQWMGHEVDVSFRFFALRDVTSAMADAGLQVTAQLERTSYPGEVATRRGYLLAQRPA
ncbi:MAG: class I SAM-dependent methyltransferase [Actinomycetota bacterium]